MRLAMLLAVVLLCGCATVKKWVNLGDGQVAGTLDVTALARGAELAGRPDIATVIRASESQLQAAFGKVPAAAPVFPLLTVSTQYVDSVGTIVYPPIVATMTPTYGPIIVTQATQRAYEPPASPLPAVTAGPPVPVPAPGGPMPADVRALLDAITEGGK